MFSSDQIVSECDKGVKKMKQIEELVCLEMLLDFGKMKVSTSFVKIKISNRLLFNRLDCVLQPADGSKF